MARFVLTAVFVALFSLGAFAGPPSLVIVQHHYDAIVITRGVGQTETVEALMPTSSKNYQANAEQLYKLFSGLYAEGYALQNSSTISKLDKASVVTTYVFVKP